MKDYKYRECRKCEKQWNVSRQSKNDKRYICPVCSKINGGKRNGTET